MSLSAPHSPSHVRPRGTIRATVRATVFAVISAVVLTLVGPAPLPGAAAAATWSTSFETTDAAPPDGELATGQGGRPDVSGVTRPDSAEPGLRTVADDGPDRAYAAKTDVGFTGLRALHYSGRHETTGPARATNVIAEVNIPVTRRTELSYLVFPDFDEQAVDYASTHVAIDLAFSDGSRLSDLRVNDQNGVRLAARAQGESATMSPLQWNDRSAPVGRVAAGRTIEAVLLSYDGPRGPAELGGWIDDLRIADAPREPQHSRPSDWVRTTRGTQSNADYSRGNNIPATAMPNGFNFWTPMTDAGSLGSLYRYHEDNNEQNLPELQAFAASHETSIWMGDRQTFQFMPSVATGVPDPDRAARALPFRHANETASPHRYAVTFDNGLRTEIAPTDHAAMVRFAFPKTGGRHLIFDNVDDRADVTIDRQAGTVTGWSETRTISAGMSRMYLYATFDAPVTGSGKLSDGHRPSTGYVSFDRDVVTMRVATSLIGVEQAKRNLELELSRGDTVSSVAARAQRAWDKRLGVVEVEGASEDQLRTLYSNLYRLFLYPNSAHENTGTAARPRYRHAVQSTGSWTPPASSPTRTGARIANGKVYVNTGFWDTFRAAWPAYALLAPDTAGELVDGFVQQYRDGGWISPWSSPGYARVMTGTSSDAAFADAYVKGVPGIDPADTYAAALRNATVRPPENSVGRDGLERSLFRGYVSNDVGAGFAWSKDGYLNDFAIAEQARAMTGDRRIPRAERARLREEAAYFRARAAGYRELFDPATGFFQGRAADGRPTTAAEKYDPKVWGNDHDYTEANGWNETFIAPHDGEGLATLYGGRAKLAAKLDEYFATPETALSPGSYGGVIHEMRETRDFRLGQWAIPNQVSYHIPWMYNYTQQPWKGQQQIRKALSRGWVGSEIGQGYPGDEDNGASSAWWILSALGIYPLQVGSGEYAIGSPLFERARLRLPGRDLVIEAPGTSRGNLYVQGLTVDGKPHTGTSIGHEELADGGVLRFRMGPKPSAWGTRARDVPDSLTERGEQPRPLRDVTGPNRGVATASTGADVDALFDDSSGTATTLRGRNPAVRYDVNGGERTGVEFYTLTSGAGAAREDPSSWVLEGSNDGRRWRTLDRRTGEDFAWRNQTRPFQLDQPVRMDQYRVRVLGGQRTVSLAEVELLTRDELPAAALRLEVGDAVLRAGSTAEIEVVATNTGRRKLAPELGVSVPRGWSAEPGSATPVLAPGASATTTVRVTAPPDAAPGIQPVRVRARWDGWTLVGSGDARVVGDVTEIRPGTASETGVLVADDGSQLTSDGADGQARFADERRSFTYQLPVPAAATGAAVTLDLANQFLVEASTDGTTWRQVLREPGAAMFQNNRQRRALDLAELRAQAGGTGQRLYLRFGDSRPEDGWGGWLAGVHLETSG